MMTSSYVAAACKVDLKDGRGLIRRSFYGPSCYSARAQCQSKLDRMYRRGRLRFGSCRVDFRDRDRMVRRSCQADMVSRGRFPRVLRTFTATAFGRRGSRVKERACDQALRQCRQNKRRFRGYGRRGPGRRNLPLACRLTRARF